MRYFLPLILVVLSGLTAHAQVLPPANAANIEPGAWMERVEGRTVIYLINGQPFGREYYWPGTRNVTFQTLPNGECMDGRWSYDPAQKAYCFAWPSGSSCFRHVASGEEIFIIPTTPDSSVQTVGEITSDSFSCTPAGLS